MRRRALTSLPVTGRTSASRGRFAGRGGGAVGVDVAGGNVTGGGFCAGVVPSAAASCSGPGRTAEGGGAEGAPAGGRGAAPGGLAGPDDGGGAYFGVLAWKKDRIESWAGFDDGRDMVTDE